MKNTRPPFDEVIMAMADYVLNYKIENDFAYETAYYCLLDAIACALMALKNPQCVKLLGPVVPKATCKQGARVLATPYVLDPVQAAFNIGTMIRWLDYNDTWLAAEWGHPSDNLGGLLAISDYLTQTGQSISIETLLTALIKAYEIQGVLALENSFNRVGLDHVVLVKVATTAVTTHLLGGDRQQILNAISQAWIDGQSLRTYRHAPNTGSRKSWAAGDATSRGVRLALISKTGEMGYPSALTAATWGFYDALFKGQSFQLQRPYGTYVIENILFKVAFPAEFHAQTAVECALALYPSVKERIDDIETIRVETQEAAMRIINKTGPLYNPADRDHCLQYMIAIPLLFGQLNPHHYEEQTAADPRIDLLREKMEVKENTLFSQDYLDPSKRSIPNALQIFFNDGSSTERIAIEYPLGHRLRRKEALPLLQKKFKQAIEDHFPKKQVGKIQQFIADSKKLKLHTVSELINHFI